MFHTVLPGLGLPPYDSLLCPPLFGLDSDVHNYLAPALCDVKMRQARAMTKFSQIASTPPTPPPRCSLVVLLLQAMLFAFFWSPVPHTHAAEVIAKVDEGTTNWVPPVADAGPTALLKPFVAPQMPWSAAHRGIDIRASTEQVLAPAAGEVTFVGQVVDRPVITIRHSNGLLSSFEPVDSDLEVGTVVASGEPLGKISAETGHCEVQCVHWGVRVPDGWQIGSTVRDLYIDPGFLLGWTEPSILWPVHSEPAS
ncbi:peptidase M23-like protein [Enteractinococcus coprophilus]|uniref:Peptidase M23-like protein n=2 Tax=Enteractinococcus coprophilus TaxID=1027633 RepID=A0A543AF74_9MICC|nr:peptidase M23-like protein [Enteractinococcus coprophilus]